MHDMYRTRENEGPCICESCDQEEDTCGMNWSDCQEIAMGDAIDAAYERWRDEQ